MVGNTLAAVGSLLSGYPKVPDGNSFTQTFRNGYAVGMKAYGKAFVTTSGVALADTVIDTMTGSFNGYRIPEGSQRATMSIVDTATMTATALASMRFNPLKVAAAAIGVHSVARFLELKNVFE